METALSQATTRFWTSASTSSLVSPMSSVTTRCWPGWSMASSTQVATRSHIARYDQVALGNGLRVSRLAAEFQSLAVLVASLNVAGVALDGHFLAHLA
jgi:hypothetical protein